MPSHILQILILLGLTEIKVSHEAYHPGFVNTKQALALPLIMRKISKLFEQLIEPETAGKILTKHIKETEANNVASKFYYLGKAKKELSKELETLKELINFSKEVTGVDYFDFKF